MTKTIWTPLAAAALLGTFVTAPVAAYAAPTPTATRPAAAEARVTCAQVGHKVYRGGPGYAKELDRNNDGVGCEDQPDLGRVSNVVPGADRSAWCSEITRRNIPKGDPQYSTARDRDLDGIACESGTDDDFTTSAPSRSATPTKPANRSAASKPASAKDSRGGLAKTGA